MANGQGGARIGAGRKKKALADNLADGNPGKRKLTVLDFTDSAADLEGQTMPPPKAFLAAKQKNGKDLLAVEVYEETWKWLVERNCAQLIPAQILEQYAMAISRWIQCEECITEYGFLAKHPTTGNAIPSPYFARFNVEGLLRGDYQSRMNGYAVARQNGWMSANDIRELENLDRIPTELGGDLYLINGNMTKLADAGLFATRTATTTETTNAKEMRK